MLLFSAIILTGCNSLSSSSNSTSLANIKTNVIIANTVNYNGQVSSRNGYDYWVVQISLTNNEPQSIIIVNGEMVSRNNPASMSYGKLNLPIQPVQSESTSSEVTFTSGESGKIALCFFMANSINPDEYQLRLMFNAFPTYNGTQSVYSNLNVSDTYAQIYDWDSQTIEEIASLNPITTQPPIHTPSGTYTWSFGDMHQTATFKSPNILNIYDAFDGEINYTYSISGDMITETNIATGQSGNETYQYLQSQNEVILGGNSYFK